MSNKIVLITGLACGLLLVILVNIFTGEDKTPEQVTTAPVTPVNPPQTPTPAIVPESLPPVATEQPEEPIEPATQAEDPNTVDSGQAEDPAAANASNEELLTTRTTPAPLPDLNESDRFVMTQVYTLDNASDIIFQMTSEQIIRKFVGLVDGMSRGDIPSRDLPVFPPREELDVTEIEDGLYRLNPSSYARFDQLVNTFTAMDSEITAQMFMRMTPLFDTAYAELGYPGQAFDDALQKAIDNVLTAELPDEEVLLTRPSVNYLFADPALENRTTLEKLLIRMGPDNAHRVQQKVREISTFLETP